MKPLDRMRELRQCHSKEAKKTHPYVVMAYFALVLVALSAMWVAVLSTWHQTDRMSAVIFLVVFSLVAILGPPHVSVIIPGKDKEEK